MDFERGFRWKGLPVLLYAGASLLVLAPHVFPLTEISAATYAFGDAAYSLWSFWWTRTALLQATNPWWTGSLFHPDGVSLAYHQYAFSYSLLSLPFQQLMPGPRGLAFAFNAMLFASFVLAGWGAHLLALRLTGSLPGACLAGLLYTLVPYHVLNSPRIGLVALELLPFYVLALLRLAERPAFGRAVLLAACLALAYYTSVEYAFYLVLFSLLWLAHAAWNGRIDRARMGWLAAAAAVFALFAAPLLVQQLVTAAGAPDSVGGKLETAALWSPALASFVTPSRLHPLWGDAFAFAGHLGDGWSWGMRTETSFCITGWGLALLGVARGGRARRFWALVAAIFLCLALGPTLRLTGTWETGLPLPYRLLYELVPPMRAVQEPSRLLPVAFLALSMLAAMGARALGERLPQDRRTQAVAIGLLGFLLVFENLTAWPWQRVAHMRFEWIAGAEPLDFDATPCCDPFYREIAAEPGDFAVMVVDLLEPHGVLAQTLHGRRAAQWQGFVPRAANVGRTTPLTELHHDLLHPRRILKRPPAQREAKEAGYRRALAEAGVRYVVVSIAAAQPAQALLRRLADSVRREGRLLVAELPH